MNFWIKTNQILLWCIARFYILITFSNRKVYLQNTTITRDYGYVLAGNHQSKLDPFALLGALPFRIYYRLLPIRSMAHREFFSVAFYRIFLHSWGAFPNKEIEGMEYGLPLSAKILANKGTILIFPEGTRVKKGTYIEPKRGVSVMASEPATRIIMCHNEWKGKFLRRVSVVISNPVNCNDQTSQQIMNHIYELK